MRRLRCLLLVINLMPVALGCRDSSREITGGTEGVLRIAGAPLGEIKISFFEKSGERFESVGFGVTDDDGVFRLFQNEARGDLHLPAGQYRCTIETIGPPLRLSSDYLNPVTSPVNLIWDGGDTALEIKIQ